jgi:hypothetical protein
MTITKHMQERLDSLQIVPRLDILQAIAQRIAAEGRCDEQLAPIWAEKLRYTYTKVLETIYPEYAAANGDVLPIDTSVPPADLTWEYYMVNQAGYADWIDDDGHVMPSGSVSATRHVGRTDEMGHRWDETVFELERAAKANTPISAMKAANAKRVHDAKTNWVWLFGDSEKDLPGLCNHPNIPVTLAAAAAGGTNSRLWGVDKTIDEIAADVSLLIDTVATNTIGAYHAVTVFMPRTLFHILRNFRLGAGDGFSSLLEYIKDRYKGDDSESGSQQGRVAFRILNETQATLRLNPRTQTDTSTIAGDFLLALPTPNKDELAFIRSRPFTQRPPQERDLVMYHMTHSKIGGCKMTQPLAVHRLDFGV